MANKPLPSDDQLYCFSPEQKSLIIEQIKKELQKHPQIRFAFLHGSFLGKQPCHDLDIAIFFDDSLADEAILDLTLELTVTLTCKIHLPVDVRSLNQANTGFRYHVTKGVLLISKDEEETYDFMEKTWRDYLDFQPLAMQVLKDLIDKY
ncbi:MAG TPA: nucleotidyltransferase domain-containing protein [Syntrophaceticus sp.]|uniref:Predicted nucleotidyltransferases (Modular protein) n=1 Tax=Syntrophaceticus schinkii TaxID=499207 RepID=A0A0B7MCS9_9FIRM|nr:nucleotidyltransferase domain-containing protein [Syntrophaceticus schinkii]HHY30401.1 nucleotidyltransferase domain-containing protein [Syntrophaceticus sp.]MDD2359564.1 nucleotidyltransferase domain-containing protein [Syntrophaceticus schinkii]MDD4262669.1 nucleotidyltransferase domain-containing protein [Syntrophaceticus schinkii]MDD4674725.1 nucleotidyltransferase domain-containing protein [Syntrophaceticus schinkii]CEO88344.1 Predicted nucleotidyltransferases (modular protein) [Syntro